MVSHFLLPGYRLGNNSELPRRNIKGCPKGRSSEAGPSFLSHDWVVEDTFLTSESCSVLVDSGHGAQSTSALLRQRPYSGLYRHWETSTALVVEH